MGLQRIHLFLSSAWNDTRHADRLAEWIFEQHWQIGDATLDFRDLSIPRSDPVLDEPHSDAARREREARIARSHVVVVPAGLPGEAQAPVEAEIEAAHGLRRPVLAVDVQSRMGPPCTIRAKADDHCPWQDKAMISKIWRLYNDH
ncbi:MAG: hypothetical protein CTY25_06215 [Methylobacterium sp.]|nr:MAG: hypothetical protein CTY25_06215 [Methylobacterium sp.]